MSRKDTIIIAVLINAGLLIVLFATALKPSDSKEEEFVTPPAPVAAVSEVPMGGQLQAPQDEVDQVLRQFSQPQTSALTPPSSSFAEDLNAPPSLPSIETPMPVVAPVLAPSVQEQLVEVKVKKGDVLEKIARQNRTTVAEIMKVNHLATTNLKIGQVLRIPSKSAAASSTASTPDGEAKYYTVKNGDNPWTIAVKNHMKLEELLKLNNLDSEKARRLKPGDQLRIR